MKRISGNYKIKDLLFVIVSGIATQLAITHQLGWLAWIAYVPYFLILIEVHKKQSFFYGVLFGLSIAVPSFFWMIPGSARFTGSSSGYGIVVYVISVGILAAYFGLINLFLKQLQIKSGSKAILLNAFIYSAVFVIGEYVFSAVFETMPWFGFHSGMALTSNIYFIQPASAGGIPVLSFFVVLVNAFIAITILQKRFANLWIPVSVFCLYFLWGFLEYQNHNRAANSDRSINVALVNSNIAPEIKWNDSTGNFLVNGLFDLNKKAAALHPDLVVWTESAVPWTYSADDDFLKEINRIYQNDSATQLLGMNTESGHDVVYNSVYCIQPDGRVESRYDKRFLLSMIEERKAGILFPFLSSNGFEVAKGESMEPLNTPFGKAGIMICNESTVASAARDMVRNGADFFVNISNDGWFSNSYLVDLHFYNARLRAVEQRKPLIINSNRGYSGAIDANGDVLRKIKSDEPFVETVKIDPDSDISFYYNFPYFILAVSILTILAAFYFKLKK